MQRYLDNMNQELEDLANEIRLSRNIDFFSDIDSFVEHIFEANNYTGYHSEYYNQGLFNIKRKQLGRNAYWGYWDGKTIGSSFFPMDWNGKKVIEECISAFCNPYRNKRYSGKYGKSKSGIYIRFELDNKKKIVDAYPCKVQDDNCFEKILNTQISID